MTVPCSTLLLLAGTWGSCLTFRVEEESAVDEENVGRECGCTLVEDREWEREREKRETETFAYDFIKYNGHTANQCGPKCKSDKHTASRSTHFHEQTVKSLPDQYLHDRVILLICIIAKSYKEIKTSTRAEGVKTMKK